MAGHVPGKYNGVNLRPQDDPEDSLSGKRARLIQAVRNAQKALDAAWESHRADCERAFKQYRLREAGAFYDNQQIESFWHGVQSGPWQNALIDLLKAQAELGDYTEFYAVDVDDPNK
jgi:hypothetical protein